jgi:hypothetical protein
MSYALLVFLLGTEVRIETFATMLECEAKKAEIYNETGGRARCLWMREPARDA